MKKLFLFVLTAVFVASCGSAPAIPDSQSVPQIEPTTPPVETTDFTLWATVPPYGVVELPDAYAPVIVSVGALHGASCAVLVTVRWEGVVPLQFNDLYQATAPIPYVARESPMYYHADTIYHYAVLRCGTDGQVGIWLDFVP